MRISCVLWEFEDQLPPMMEEEYDAIFRDSKVIGGLRMFPYVWSEDEHGEPEKAFLSGYTDKGGSGE